MVKEVVCKACTKIFKIDCDCGHTCEQQCMQLFINHNDKCPECRHDDIESGNQVCSELQEKVEMAEAPAEKKMKFSEERDAGMIEKTTEAAPVQSRIILKGIKDLQNRSSRDFVMGIMKHIRFLVDDEVEVADDVNVDIETMNAIVYFKTQELKNLFFRYAGIVCHNEYGYDIEVLHYMPE